MPLLIDLIRMVKADKRERGEQLDDNAFAAFVGIKRRNVEEGDVDDAKVLLGEYAVAKASLVCGGGDKSVSGMRRGGDT